MGEFIIRLVGRLSGALGYNFIFICLVISSLGFARVRSIVFGKPKIVYIPIGLGIAWYSLVFIINFIRPSQSITDLTDYYYGMIINIIVFIIIAIIGFTRIKKRVSITRDKWDNKT